MSCFRIQRLNGIPNGYHNFPHSIHKVSKGKDGKPLTISVLEDFISPIDQNLSWDWTSIDNLSQNGVSLSPISGYIESSIESKVEFVREASRLIDLDLELNQPVEPTVEPPVEPTVEPNVEPNVEPSNT